MGHGGCVVWFTGLSGSGKSTVANAVDSLLCKMGAHTFLLDGDNVRHSLTAAPQKLAPTYGDAFAKRFGLGFSEEDRQENIRRVGATAQLFASAGLITLTALVSPYRLDRDLVRALVEKQIARGRFVEVFMDTPLAICEERDPKGLYQKARTGQLRGMTGIDDPYEAPLAPELHLQGNGASVEELAGKVVSWLSSHEILSAGNLP